MAILCTKNYVLRNQSICNPYIFLKIGMFTKNTVSVIAERYREKGGMLLENEEYVIDISTLEIPDNNEGINVFEKILLWTTEIVKTKIAAKYSRLEEGDLEIIDIKVL